MLIKKLKSALINKNHARITSLIKKITGSNLPTETLLEACFHLLKSSENYDEQALVLLKKGLLLKPSYADKAHALVREPFMLDRDDIKEKILNIGLDVDSKCFANVLELALVYIGREQFVKAEPLLLAALEIDSTRYEPLINLTDLYLKMNRYHDAYACAQLAVDVSPKPELAYYNLGIISMMTARYKEAILSFEKVLQINPNHNDARLSFGQLLLKAGNFELGWSQLEYRWHESQKINKINLPLPPWQGQPIAGKGLIVWGDQGLGDSIMYASLFNRLIEAGCRLSVVCSRRLENLFSRSFNLEKYYAHGENETINISGSYQYQISIGSLPGQLIHGFNDFGKGSAYLKADPVKVDKYRQDLRALFPQKILVGFTWRGGLSHTRKFARDTGLDIWAPLMALEKYQFINLQYDTTEEDEEKIRAMGGHVTELDCRNDIDGLAAMISGLDLVISADNTTVHLAGALGVKVWTLLPFSSEWRWFFEEEKTHWYESMQLFHQQQLNDWEACFDNVEKALQTFLVNN